MKAKTFLDIHNALLNNQKLAYGNCQAETKLFNGLCGFILNKEQLRCNSIFQLFKPTRTEIVEYNLDNVYYYDLFNSSSKGTEYNELRQNVILLCAAINGEL